MTAAEYRRLRKAIGTQQGVAAVLGIAQKQISDRERGKTQVSRSDEFALRWMYFIHKGEPYKAKPRTKSDAEQSMEALKLRRMFGEAELYENQGAKAAYPWIVVLPNGKHKGYKRRENAEKAARRAGGW